MHLTNSFMYRKETITAAYEGAGWTFPTENYCFTPPLRVHHQGFEIIRRALFLLLLFLSQILESSLEPNWLPPTDVMADEWDLMKEWPFLEKWYSEKNEVFCFLSSIYHRDPLKVSIPPNSASSSPRNLKTSLMPFMKDLQRD